MTTRILSAAAALAVALSLAGPAGAQDFEISRAKTEAEILMDSISGDMQVKLELHADTVGGAPPDDSLEMMLGWGAVGATTPDDGLEVTIPSGCFVENAGFHVADFASCGPRGTGVMIVLVTDGVEGPALSVAEFGARLVFDARDGSASFRMEALFSDQGDEPVILGLLGGGVLTIEMSTETAMGMGTAVPLEVDTLAVPPDPI